MISTGTGGSQGIIFPSRDIYIGTHWATPSIGYILIFINHKSSTSRVAPLYDPILYYPLYWLTYRMVGGHWYFHDIILVVTGVL